MNYRFLCTVLVVSLIFWLNIKGVPKVVSVRSEKKSEAWNSFLILIQGNRCLYWSENRKILKFLSQNHISGGNFMRRIDCAHSQTLKTLPWPWFREGIGVLKRKSNIFGFLWENRRFLGFSRRGIDCAHSRSLKTLLWPWFREIRMCIEAKILHVKL